MAKHNITHGHWIGNKPSAEYKAWHSMKSRCLNPSNASYQNYGGRGITIHKEWINCFESFLNYVGYKPHKKLSLDRINNDQTNLAASP